MPKKIVHIIIGLNVGGAELMLKRLILNSQPTGEFLHEVVSLTDLGVIGKDLQEIGIKVHTLNMKSLFSIFKVYFSLKKILIKINPDIVQTWMYHADFLGGIAAKNVGIKKIIWGIRTTDVTQGGSKLTILLSQICAKLSYSIPTKIVCAAHISKDFHLKLGYDPSKMIVIPNGFELDKFEISEERRTVLRADLNIAENEIVIASIGRFNLVKNQYLFIKLANCVKKNHNNIRFLMIGRDNTWDNKELVKWINEFNLIDDFILLGQQSDIIQYMNIVDIFCLHSKTEGFPNVLAEAMAMKRFCIATDVGDAKYLLQKEFCVPEGSLVQVLNKAIEAKDIRDINSLLNYKVIKNYSMTEYLRKMHGLYLL